VSQLGDIETGRAIADRLESGAVPARQGYCPDCRKAIAAVVAHGGDVWLFAPGGRVGSNAALISELEDEARDYGDDPRPAAILLHESFSRFAEQARDSTEAAITPPAAQKLNESAFAWGNLTVTVGCRGCRCWRSVSLTKDLRLTVGARVPPWPNV
jgi:hypothetical protein